LPPPVCVKIVTRRLPHGRGVSAKMRAGMGDAVAAPIIWKEIMTAFEGRTIGGSYTAEDGVVRVKTTLGKKVAPLDDRPNAALVAWRLLRELAAEGKA
jgi:hypothetical protein